MARAAQGGRKVTVHAPGVDILGGLDIRGEVMRTCSPWRVQGPASTR
ncbi:hypothetical protein AB0O22_23055 [Streptomyces sp. NPDC091204]